MYRRCPTLPCPLCLCSAQDNPQTAVPLRLVQHFLGEGGHAHTLLANAEQAALDKNLPGALTSLRRLLQGARQIGALRTERRVKELQVSHNYT